MWHIESHICKLPSNIPEFCLSTADWLHQRNRPRFLLLILCEGNTPVTGGFPSQRATNDDTVSMAWRFHDAANHLHSDHCGFVYGTRGLTRKTSILASLTDQWLTGHWPSSVRHTVHSTKYGYGIVLFVIILYVMNLLYHTFLTETFDSFNYYSGLHHWQWGNGMLARDITLNPMHGVLKWKHFPRYWPFVWGIHRSAVNSPHKGQWRGPLMFSFICAWINGWVNNPGPLFTKR